MLDQLPAIRWGDFGLKDVKGVSVELKNPIKDFYLTNVIAKASPTMQECSRILVHGEQVLEAAE